MTSVQGPGTLISEAFRARGTHPGTWGEGRERTTLPCILQRMGHLVARVGLFSISIWRCFKTKNMTVADNWIWDEGITVLHWLHEVLPTHSSNEGLSCRFIYGLGQEKHLSNWMGRKSRGDDQEKELHEQTSKYQKFPYPKWILTARITLRAWENLSKDYKY